MKLGPLLIFITTILFPTFAFGQVDFFGSLENRLNGYAGGESDRVEFGDTGRIRLGANVDGGETFSGRGEVEIVTLLGRDAVTVVALDPSFVPILQRLYLRGRWDLFDAIVGRQRVAWGVGSAFRPTDRWNLVNPLAITAFKKGVDAVQVLAFPSDLWETSVVFAPGSDGKTVRAGARVEGHLGSFDLSASYLYDEFTSRDMVGLDFKGDLIVGVHGEAAYLPENGWKGERYIRLSGGIDYSFFGSLFLLAEYFYDNSGADDPEKYDRGRFADGLTTWLGQQYAFSQVSYQLDEFSSLGASYLMNILDRSFVLNLFVASLLADNVNVGLDQRLLFGDEKSEYRPFQDLPWSITTLRWEMKF